MTFDLVVFGKLPDSIHAHGFEVRNNLSVTPPGVG